MALTVSALACPANHPCPSIRVCPESAIKQVGVGLPTIDENKCTECGACISYCPKGAFIPKD